jgi:hypothetical protein
MCRGIALWAIFGLTTGLGVAETALTYGEVSRYPITAAFQFAGGIISGSDDFSIRLIYLSVRAARLLLFKLARLSSLLNLVRLPDCFSVQSLSSELESLRTASTLAFTNSRLSFLVRLLCDPNPSEEPAREFADPLHCGCSILILALFSAAFRSDLLRLDLLWPIKLRCRGFLFSSSELLWDASCCSLFVVRRLKRLPSDHLDFCFLVLATGGSITVTTLRGAGW